MVGCSAFLTFTLNPNIWLCVFINHVIPREEVASVPISAGDMIKEKEVWKRKVEKSEGPGVVGYRKTRQGDCTCKFTETVKACTELHKRKAEKTPAWSGLGRHEVGPTPTQLTTVWRRKVGFLQWSDTWYTDHSPGQGPMPISS